LANASTTVAHAVVSEAVSSWLYLAPGAKMAQRCRISGS
jgi:hypothetical protein